MKRCPITYQPFEGPGMYSAQGLRLLSPKLSGLAPLPFSKQALLQEAASRATKMSIQGVQPKLSAALNRGAGLFELVDTGGQFILKPDHPYWPQVPENEDLTMRLVATVGIETPVHGLVGTASGEWCYFIKRFDRGPRHVKYPMEDLAQVTGQDRETKYRSSIEKVAKAVKAHASFPTLELAKLWQVVLISYLTCNGDMHLKNFSLVTDAKGIVKLSPAYDHVNTRLILGKAEDEQFALTLRGKRNRLKPDDLLSYLPAEVLGLPTKVAAVAVRKVQAALPQWPGLIAASFLTDERKEAYLALVQERAQELGWSL